MVSGATGRWTVPRDALTCLGRSPPPRPGEWNVHRDNLAPLERIPTSPPIPSPTLWELFQRWGLGSSPPAHVPDTSSELRVDGVVAGKKTSFIVDTGAAFSLLTSYSGPTQDSELTIRGVSGVPLRPKIRPPFLCQFGKLTLIHSFLIMLKCPMAFLERDLLSKLGVFITINHPLLCSFDMTTLTHSFIIVPQCPVTLIGHDLLTKLQISINLPFLDPISILYIQMAPKPLASPHSQNLPPELPRIDPQVWNTKAPSIARHHSPIQVFLKNHSQIITQTQYTLTTESQQGLKPIISQLLKAGLLRPICSPHNTPILAVKKRPHSWHLVQDLHKVNEAIIPVHPVVTNPFTLLSHIPSDTLYSHTHTHTHWTDLNWMDPDTYQSQQLT